MKTINDYAYNSKLKYVSPLQKICISFLWLVLCISIKSFVLGVFTTIFTAILLNRVSGISFKKYLKLLCIPLAFILLGSMSILIDISTTQIDAFSIKIGIFYFGTKVYNIKMACFLLFRSIGAVSSMYFMSLSTTMNDIFVGLRKMKVPELMLSLMGLIYRYIFVLFDEVTRIRTAQYSRMGYTSFLDSIICTGKLFASLFIKTYARCDRIYNALLSRGYSDKFVEVNKKYYISKKLNIVFFVYVILILIILAIEKRMSI